MRHSLTRVSPKTSQSAGARPIFRNMFSAFFKVVGQVSDPAFQRVIWRSLGWSLLLFGFLLALGWWVIMSTQMFGTGWLEWAADVLGWIAVAIAAILLFPGAVVIVISFLLEDIAQAVEAKHYPGLPPPRDVRLSETVWTALTFGAIALALNLFLLPLYFFPVLNVFVFGAVNGYLLGREYFELVASRRLEPEAVKTMRRRYRGRIWGAGVLVAGMLSIPIVNWFLPVVAAAMMLHLFEKLRQGDALAGR